MAALLRVTSKVTIGGTGVSALVTAIVVQDKRRWGLTCAHGLAGAVGATVLCGIRRVGRLAGASSLGHDTDVDVAWFELGATVDVVEPAQGTLPGTTTPYMDAAVPGHVWGAGGVVVAITHDATDPLGSIVLSGIPYTHQRAVRASDGMPFVQGISGATVVDAAGRWAGMVIGGKAAGAIGVVTPIETLRAFLATRGIPVDDTP